nr:unnamed protein product [Callosobruchus analis]
MSENRLNGLANLNIHRWIQVDTNEVLAILKEKGPRRLDFVLIVINHHLPYKLFHIHLCSSSGFEELLVDHLEFPYPYFLYALPFAEQKLSRMTKVTVQKHRTEG